jgi:hypothetical protein
MLPHRQPPIQTSPTAADAAPYRALPRASTTLFASSALSKQSLEATPRSVSIFFSSRAGRFISCS